MFAFAVNDPSAARLARAWLWLGIVALAGSGLLAILLALSRTPGIQDLLPGGDFFRATLIVHVDLSVLVWFLAFACVLWSAGGNGRQIWLGWLACVLCTAGVGFLALSPFLPDAHPLLNNYIPVLDQPQFILGLLICGAGFTLAMVRALFTVPLVPAAPLSTALWLAALTGLFAVATTLATWLLMPAGLDRQPYFETLFWAGGHVLQFEHALLAALAWCALAEECGGLPCLPPRRWSLLFAVAALPVLAAPYLLANAAPGTPAYVVSFARLMEMGHPLLLPLLVLALVALWRNRGVASPARSALAASLLLFIVGGVLAYLIRGANVVIPAHYHGAIVGVTLAFMGLAYVLLPRLGFRPVEGRMARLQPYVYAGGQLLHVLGLAWSGGYGVQRKVAGAEQMLVSLPQKIGMGMMGLGGLIAVIGGVMFVVVCLRAMLSARQR
jgi:hypothetical protein